MSIVFKIENQDELERLFKKAPQVTRKWISKGLVASIQVLQKYNRKGITPWDTGAMSQTFQWSPKNPKDHIKFYPTRKYAKYVYHGTRYQKPQKFLDVILQKATPELTRLFQDVAKNITKEL